MLPPKKTLAALLIAAAGTAHAVPYTLPTSDARPYAKLSGADGSTICATWQDGGACDVPCGTYRLHRFDVRWGDESSNVETCPADDDPVAAAPADCPAGLAETLERLRTLPPDGELIGNWQKPLDAPGYCLTGRQFPGDGTMLLEVTIRASGVRDLPVSQFDAFAPAQIRWADALSEGFSMPLSASQARSCAAIAGCARY